MSSPNEHSTTGVMFTSAVTTALDLVEAMHTGNPHGSMHLMSMISIIDAPAVVVSLTRLAEILIERMPESYETVMADLRDSVPDPSEWEDRPEG